MKTPLISSHKSGALLLRFYRNGRCYAALFIGSSQEAMVAYRTLGIRCLPYNEATGEFSVSGRESLFQLAQRP